MTKLRQQENTQLLGVLRYYGMKHAGINKELIQ